MATTKARRPKPMKSMLTISVDTELLLAAKKKAGYGNFSKRIEQLIKAWVESAGK